VFELPQPRMMVTEHQIVAVACGCGQVTSAAAPAGVSGRVQYGPTVKAAAVYARGAQFLPYARAARLLGDLTGAHVSTGFVHSVFLDAAARLAPFTDRLRDLLRAVPVLHADETPARVAGRWGYVHVACTDTLTLFHVGGRSAADVDAGGVLPGFTGTIVHDGYAAYQHLSDATHAWCGAHYADLRIMPSTMPKVLVKGGETRRIGRHNPSHSLKGKSRRQVSCPGCPRGRRDAGCESYQWVWPSDQSGRSAPRVWAGTGGCDQGTRIMPTSAARNPCPAREPASTSA
jgi:hypothetical protein